MCALSSAYSLVNECSDDVLFISNMRLVGIVAKCHTEMSNGISILRKKCRLKSNLPGNNLCTSKYCIEEKLIG